MLPAQPVIAVIGAGSMGGVYAGFFAEAGYKVIVIDLWAEHIAAIHENGLRLSGVSGDRIITGITASTDIHAARDADLFIIATKASGVAVAARGIAAMFHSSQLVLTIQNGLGAADRIAAHMPVD
ncbi:MAG: ketopantoate reductase family protein, partial [Candidatus Puniceispirillales bacterium]